jgi:TRAP-type C4-dicarboxylate transport system permease large subunit
MILTRNVANITPPVGVAPAAASGIAGAPVRARSSKRWGTIPCCPGHMVAILPVGSCPASALWLPGLVRRAPGGDGGHGA